MAAVSRSQLRHVRLHDDVPWKLRRYVLIQLSTVRIERVPGLLATDAQ